MGGFRHAVLDLLNLQSKARTTLNAFTGIAEINLIGIGRKQFIKDGYKVNPMLFSIVNWITRRTARINFQLFDVTNSKEKVELFEHDYLTLLNNPNPAQSKREFFEALTGYKKITGETFIHGAAPEGGVNAGQPQELWVLPSPLMKVRFDAMGMASHFSIENGGREQPIKTEEILYMREFNPGEGNRGMSPIEAGLKTVTMSNDAYEANARLLKNSAAKGLLSMDDDGHITEEQINKMQTKINEQTGGASNYGKVNVSSLKWKWQQIGLSAKDLVLIETHGLNREDMCNIYQLPTELFNDRYASTYNNVQEARKTAITDAILPENDAIVDGFNNWLTPIFSKRDNRQYLLAHDEMVYPEMQKNNKELSEWLSTAWWLTGNQKLAIMNMATDNDNPILNEILIPSNLIPTGQPDELEKAYNRHIEITELQQLLKMNGNVT